jgi:hypothetical protein
LAFSLKSRNDFHDAARIAKKKNIPPPGHYEDTLALAPTGKYNCNSEWVNSKAQKWAPASDRFKLDRASYRFNPGPGTYNQHGELNKGHQHNSNFHSIKTPSFGIGERPDIQGSPKRF